MKYVSKGVLDIPYDTAPLVTRKRRETTKNVRKGRMSGLRRATTTHINTPWGTSD